ncbi:hypothetical protein PHISCL_09907, partial [Aspergillus sclerotialis]
MTSIRTQIRTSLNFRSLQSDSPETFWGQLTDDERRASVDRTWSRKIRGGFAWGAAGRVKEKWNNDIYPDLKAFLNEKHRDLKNRKSRKMPIYNVVCWMVGTEWNLSRPATVFVCGSEEVANRALRQIRRFLKLGNSGFLAYTSIDRISLNGGTSTQGPSGKIGLCGILVNLGNAHGAFERQTTVGGVICINGCYYCMTAAHPFLGMDEDCDDYDEDDDEDEDDEDEDDDADYKRDDNRVDDESLDKDFEVAKDNTIGNKDLTADHVYAGCLDSFLGTILHDDNSSREPFISRRFDWALLKIASEFEPGPNTINIPGRRLIPWKISSTFPQCPLWAATGTHNAVEIKSCPTLSGICVDDSGILDVWSLNMMSYPGDSGSWVVDPHDHSIAAIVMARCAALGVTYALPARDVFENITEIIGERIDLTEDKDTGDLLTLAAAQGKTELVEELLGSGIGVDSKDKMGRTAYDNALQAASKAGHHEI